MYNMQNCYRKKIYPSNHKITCVYTFMKQLIVSMINILQCCSLTCSELDKTKRNRYNSSDDDNQNKYHNKNWNYNYYNSICS